MIEPALQKHLQDLVRSGMAGTSHKARTFEFAKMAPKLYVGGAVCDANENEWVTWKAGVTDRTLVKSALAPSNT